LTAAVAAVFKSSCYGKRQSRAVIVVPVVVLKNPQIPESLEYGEGQVRVVVRVKCLILRYGEGGEGKFFSIAYKNNPCPRAVDRDLEYL
jgi:hypothetical protein